MSSIAVNAITDANAGNTATINAVTPNVNNVVGKNRIINGNMVIDQRNAGASVTPTSGQYVIDRWQPALTQASKYSVQQNAGAVTPPVGFANYLGVTSLSAYSVLSGDLFDIRHKIEGYNIADLAWGTADAKTVTLSFQVYSSLTGTFGGAIKNSASDRSYPFSYTISVANTWEQKTITVAGDTTGTWLTTTGIGMQVGFGLGVGSTYSGTAGAWAATDYVSATGATSVVGTSGATFYITGVQLEAGSLATAFEYRQYGTELSLCQRYFEKSNSQGTVPGDSVDSSYQTGGSGYATNGLYTSAAYFKVTKRASPNITIYKPTAGTVNGAWIVYSGGWVSSTTSVNNITDSMFSCNLTSNIVQNTGYAIQGAWTASSEL